MGATVLHEDAVFPVRRAGIPTNIRNTNAPDDPGTMIVCDISSENEMSDTDTPITRALRVTRALPYSPSKRP